jgi:hypothetical protein
MNREEIERQFFIWLYLKIWLAVNMPWALNAENN